MSKKVKQPPVSGPSSSGGHSSETMENKISASLPSPNAKKLSALSPGQWRWLSFAGMLLLTVFMFGRELFSSKDVILSGGNTDITHQFIFWREFGFKELRQGNLALWNPHIFSGAPYFGGFQSALLYPPNWLYMFLPLTKAINIGIALHVFLAGVFMYLWTENRKLHPAACLLCGVLWMFCGAHFFHIYAGHLPNLCALIWAPLLFLAIDQLFEKPSLGPCLLGGFAVAMQLLAGHPQYLFYTAVAAAIYSALCLTKSNARIPFALSLVALCVIGIGLSAAQLFTGLATTAELNRSTGISYKTASIFSFPPENFLTLLMPGFFGGTSQNIYWGRCYLWEMCIFISLTGLLLALFGAVRGDRAVRRFSVTMSLTLFLLALGSRTPLFQILFNFVPGFDKFRGLSKFMFLASTFLILLAGIGLHTLLQAPSLPRKLPLIPLSLGVFLLLILGSMKMSNSQLESGSWKKFVAKIPELKESWQMTPKDYHNPQFIQDSFRQANKSLFIAAVTCFPIALFLFLSASSRKWLFALPVLASVEILYFASTTSARFEFSDVYPVYQKQLHDGQSGDYRIADIQTPNAAMSFGNRDIWGYDPGIPLRYAQFIAFTQGINPDQSTDSYAVKKQSPLFAMLRCKYWLYQEHDEIKGQPLSNNPLPHLQLITNYRVETDRDKMFAMIADPSFDPRKQIILEKEPSPKPGAAEQPGEAKVIDSSTDHLTIEAKLTAPAILLVTDSYSKDWKATALPGSASQNYEVLPANYCLRAIPLAAGDHKFRLEYLPAAFVIGKWISLFSLIVYTGLLAWWLKSKRTAPIVQKAP